MKVPERFAAGQGAGTGRNSRYQKIEGARVVRAPVSPVREDMAVCWSLTGEAGGGNVLRQTRRKMLPDPKKTVARLLFSICLTIFTSVTMMIVKIEAPNGK